MFRFSASLNTSAQVTLCFKQGSPQERPAETEVDIHVQGDVQKVDTDVQGKSEEHPNSTETVAESIDPPGPNVHTEKNKNGSAPALLEDNDDVSKTLLSHGDRESELNPKESRHEPMESSPLLQEDMASNVPHSESN